MTSQKFLLDEDKFENSFLKCMVCQEIFTRSSKLPKVLPCQHDICIECLLQMFRVECKYRAEVTNAFGTHGPSAVKIQCPACRQSFVKSEKEIQNLPTDITILELCDFIRGSERCVLSFCAKHPKVPMNFYCNSCSVQICGECTLRAHSRRSDHMVVEIEAELKERESDLDKIADSVLAESARLSEIISCSEKTVKYLDVLKKDFAQDISETFEQFSSVADTKARDIVNFSDSEIDRKCQMLRGQLGKLRQREAELKASLDLLSEARSVNDLEQISVLYNYIKDRLGETPPPPSSVDDLRYCLAFVPYDDEEETFVEFIDGYGNKIS